MQNQFLPLQGPQQIGSLARWKRGEGGGNPSFGYFYRNGWMIKIMKTDDKYDDFMKISEFNYNT